MYDKHIGTVINGYEILRISGFTSTGEKKYFAKCLKCGYIRNVTLQTIRKSTDTTCRHISQDSRFGDLRLGYIYRAMCKRCYNENDKSYKFYGAKGIKVCDDWLDNSIVFEDWALHNGYQDNLTIDRIDPSKDYEPDNCRWVDMKENSKWKSTTNYITVNGITDSGRGWSTRLNRGVNFINTMIRDKGLEYTIEYIKQNI